MFIDIVDCDCFVIFDFDVCLYMFCMDGGVGCGWFVDVVFGYVEIEYYVFVWCDLWFDF